MIYLKRSLSTALLLSVFSLSYAQNDIVEDKGKNPLIAEDASPLSLIDDKTIEQLPKNTLIPVPDDSIDPAQDAIDSHDPLQLPQQSVSSPKKAEDELTDEQKEELLDVLFAPDSIQDKKSTPEELVKEKTVIPWMWIGISAFLFLFVVGLIIYLIIRRNNRPVYVPSIFEVTMERLHTAELLMEPSKVKEFSLAVSEAVRFYLEGFFGVHSTTSTTEEFLDYYLNRTDSDLAEYRELLKEFLEHCDLAKFAGASLTKIEMNEMMACARQLVTETYREEDND